MPQQLRKDGAWGAPQTFGFVNARHVIALLDALAPTETVYLTVGLSYRNPATNDRPYAPDELSEHVRATLGDRYWYDVTRRDDGTIHVTALDSNDLL